MNEQPDRSLDYVWSLMERNPWAGGNILRGEIPRIYVVTALPTATQENRNQILILAGGAAEADKPCVCIKNDSEGYEWLELTEFTITPSSSTTDLKDAMVAASIITDGGATPLNLDGGALTSGEITCMSVNASSSVLANGTLQAQGGLLTRGRDGAFLEHLRRRTDLEANDHRVEGRECGARITPERARNLRPGRGLDIMTNECRSAADTTPRRSKEGKERLQCRRGQ